DKRPLPTIITSTTEPFCLTTRRSNGIPDDWEPQDLNVDINLLLEWESLRSIEAYLPLYKEAILSAGRHVDWRNSLGGNSKLSVWVVKDKALEYPFCGAMVIPPTSDYSAALNLMDAPEDWIVSETPHFRS